MKSSENPISWLSHENIIKYLIITLEPECIFDRKCEIRISKVALQWKKNIAFKFKHDYDYGRRHREREGIVVIIFSECSFPYH